MPGAISDSSTLIHLAKIGRLNFLRKFHKKILVAPAVWKKIVEEGKDWPGSNELKEAKQAGWLEVVEPTNRTLIHFLRKDLHEGESETIALAVENDSEIVFLDESEARRIARVYGLNITGVVGILIRAKREDMIPSLQEDLDRLRDEAGLCIGEDVTKALRSSKEERD